MSVGGEVPGFIVTTLPITHTDKETKNLVLAFNRLEEPDQWVYRRGHENNEFQVTTNVFLTLSDFCRER